MDDRHRHRFPTTARRPARLTRTRLANGTTPTAHVPPPAEHTPATHRHDPRKVAAVGNQRRAPPTRPRTSSDAIGGHYRNVRASDAAMNKIRDAFESEVVPSSRSISIAAPIEPARRLRGTATAAQVIATLGVWLKSPDSSASCVMETRRQARRLPLRRTGSCVAATPSTAWRDST